MERQSDRVEARRIYGDLFTAVSAALFTADPIGINYGSNTDEYEPEACTIIPQLWKCFSVGDVQAVVHYEFVTWFELEADDRCFGVECYAESAAAIWDLWRRHSTTLASGNSDLG